MEKHIYDIFAHRWYNGGTIWFYADPHFGDEQMKKIRKNYISDDEQVRRINSKIGKNDTLIILGDIGDLEYVKKLRGYKVLIMGNHDAGASNYKRELERYHIEDGLLIVDSEDNHLFDEVYEGALMISPKIILSHEPIPNLPSWLFNIHGHDHSNRFKGENHLNVCAEHIDYTPVPLTSIVKSGMLSEVEDIHRITIDGAIERKAKHEK